jgi:hypothetical protein
VVSCWMKIEANAGATPNWSGARIGVDLYDQNNGHNYLLGPWTPTPNESAGFVPYGTSTWTQRTIDFVVPDTAFTKDMLTGHTIPPTQANHFVIWMQVWDCVLGAGLSGNAWFADAELYINPP